MSGKLSADTERAITEALNNPTKPLVQIAAAHNVAPSTLRRALRRNGQAPREVLRGPDHPSYIDGRTQAQRGA